MGHYQTCDLWNCEKCKLLVSEDKEIVHCIEMSPGVYMVSAKFMAEIEKQVQKTTWKGSIFGVEIRESDQLPMIIEKAKEAIR